MQSQILRELNIIATNYVNAHLKKGAKKLKIQDQLEPKYVTEAKKAAKKKKIEDGKETQKELAEFFRNKNKETKVLEVLNGK